MKPTITMQSFEGQFNQSPQETAERINKSGQWKRQRIVTLIPAGEDIPVKVALSHWNLIYPPNQAVVRLAAQGMEVGDAYSVTIEQILSHPELSNWEYLLTIEHDNTPPMDGLLMLIEAMEANPELSCIGGLYYTKGLGGIPQIWGDPKDPELNFRPQPPDLTGKVVECNGTGMGFNLWRMSMFKDERFKRPFFLTPASDKGAGTQDLYFWKQAKELGYRCGIHCGVKVGHYSKAEDTLW